MSATTTSNVHSTATTTTSEFISIPVDDREHSSPVSVDADSITPVDSDGSATTGAKSASAEDTSAPARYPLSSQESAILAELINLVTSQLESPEFEIYTLFGGFNGSYISNSYSPLSTERVADLLGSYGVYRTVDGSFEYENNERTNVNSKIPELVNGIVEKYIQAQFDSTLIKSDYSRAFSRDDIDSSKINEVSNAFRLFARLSPFQIEIIQMLGTLGYCLHDKAMMLDTSLFSMSLLYDGYIFALCTTDLAEKLDDVTRQRSAQLILFYSNVFTRLFINIHAFRHILPVNYQKCCRIDRYSAIMPGLVDFYKHGDNPQSETEPSVKNPHTIGHWKTVKDDQFELTFISNLCKDCTFCNRAGHSSSDIYYYDHYINMLELVPERGIFKLYTDWRLIAYYVVLVGAIATAVSLIATHRSDGVDPGGLIGTIVLVIIASIGFVRELFYPETELRDFLRAKVAISKFSKYCKQKGVCGSCIAALAVKNRADFGPVAVGPYASIAGGKPGPAERGKIFMDEPCDIKCFYAAGFAFARRIEMFSDGFDKDIDGDTRIAKMEWPSVFDQLVKYEGRDRYFTRDMEDYFLVGNLTLAYGVATVRRGEVVRIEWLPIPINAIIH